MQSPGNTIRIARLQAGLSLEQVSAKTRIPVKNLQAIEDDHPLFFPSAFFYKSFIRQFAREVNVDYGSLEPLIQITLADMPEPAMPGQVEVVIEKAVLPPMRRSGSLRWLRPLGSLTILLLVCSGLYTYWEALKTRGKNTVSIPVQKPIASSVDAPHGSKVSPDSGFQVEISAIERSWLAIAADGQQIFSGFLEVDQTKILRGHDIGRIRTGNAGGVSLVFNGRPIGVAGPRGQIRTVVFTKDNYEVIQPTAHIALANHTVSLVEFLHLGRLRETSFLPFQGD